MEELLDYYFGSFGSALDLVIGNRRPCYFGGGWRTGGCPELRAVAEENRAVFVACLYCSVLVDQALYRHAYEVYPKTSLCKQHPKFCQGPGKGQMKPKEILRYPMHWGLVSPEALMPLAAPAAHLFIVLCETVEMLLPQVSRWDLFYRLPHLPPT